MYTITYQNNNFKQWTETIVFTNYNNVCEYLIDKGFIKDGYIFIKSETNWNSRIIAYVNLCEII